MLFTSGTRNGIYGLYREYIAHISNGIYDVCGNCIFSKEPFTVPTEAFVSYSLYKDMFSGVGSTITSKLDYYVDDNKPRVVEIKPQWSVELRVIGYNDTHVLIEPVYPNRVNEQGKNVYYDSSSYPIPTKKCMYVDPYNGYKTPDAETRYMTRADQINIGRKYISFNGEHVNTSIQTIVFEMEINKWFTLAGLYENAYRLTKRSYVSKATWQQKKYFDEANIKVQGFKNIFESKVEIKAEA